MRTQQRTSSLCVSLRGEEQRGSSRWRVARGATHVLCVAIADRNDDMFIVVRELKDALRSISIHRRIRGADPQSVSPVAVAEGTRVASALGTDGVRMQCQRIVATASPPNLARLDGR